MKIGSNSCDDWIQQDDCETPKIIGEHCAEDAVDEHPFDGCWGREFKGLDRGEVGDEDDERRH